VIVAMKPTAISVVIPTCNRANLISRAIESVLPQTESDDELIVVDDGSIDNTAQIVASYGDRIRYVRTGNRGAGAARNRGVREATRPFVAFLDSDDEWMPWHNQVLRSFMAARPDLLFCFTNYAARYSDGSERRFSLETHEGRHLNWHEIMGPSGQASSVISLPDGMEDFQYFEGDNLYLSQCSHSYVCVNALIVRRIEAGDNLRFAEDTPTAEEWECGALLARAGKSVYLHCETSWAHHHKGPRLTHADMFEHGSSRLAFMRRVWGADQQFLRDHREVYERVLRIEQINRVGGLLLRGCTRKAREEIAEMNNPPLSYSFLVRLSGPLAKGLLDCRRAIKSFLRRKDR